MRKLTKPEMKMLQKLDATLAEASEVAKKAHNEFQAFLSECRDDCGASEKAQLDGEGQWVEPEAPEVPEED
jgi:hypothetical protein